VGLTRVDTNAENLEPYQVMMYGPSEQYTRHVDYYDRDSRFFGNDLIKFGGQRIMTALLYLTTCEGGETVFRKAANNTVGMESCAKRCAHQASTLLILNIRIPALFARFPAGKARHFRHFFR
jgi:hypothetical protein